MNTKLNSGNEKIELYKLGHQQLLMTMQKRDKMVYLNLIAQAMLLALSQGIGVGPLTAQSNISINILLFAFPVSIIFTLLYIVEDGAVTSISRYLSKFYDNSFEKSPELKDFVIFVKVRWFAQIIAFCVIPTVLVFLINDQPLIHTWAHIIGIFIILSVLALSWWKKFKHIKAQTTNEKI